MTDVFFPDVTHSPITMQIPSKPCKYNAKFVAVVIPPHLRPAFLCQHPTSVDRLQILGCLGEAANRHAVHDKAPREPGDCLRHPMAMTRLPVHQPPHKPSFVPRIPRIPRSISGVKLVTVELVPPLQRRVRIPAAHPVRRPDTVAILGQEERVEAGEIGGTEGVEGDAAEGGEDAFVPRLT